MCTAGMAMLGPALLYWLHPSHVSMWQFSTKIALSPAEQARTICFRPPGPVQATHFVCLALGLPHSTIFRHFLSIFYGIPSTFHSYVDFFCARPYPTLATISTIVHLGDFSSYGPSAITYPPIPIQQLHFSSNFIDFSSIFRFSRTRAPDL